MSSPSRPTDLESLARQTGFSSSAVESMRRSLVAGGGRMAQFDHPEFGGAGQWMHGGMLMIPDFSDTALKARIARLCDALSAATAADSAAATHDGGQFQRQSSGGTDATAPDAAWYPPSLGRPDSSGAQNGARYAWFGNARRLAIDDGGSLTVYDTGDHQIGGVSQQQGPGRTISFVSQHGVVDVARLPVVDDAGASKQWGRGDPPSGDRAAPDAPGRDAAPATGAAGDPFVALEKLADLHGRGIVDDAEFAAKKAELLRRI